MGPYFHISVDDVFDSLLDVSDWQLTPRRHPFFGFCGELVSQGAMVDLYAFGQAFRPDGRMRRLDELTDTAAAALKDLPGIRFGPHALDYATAPHAQPVDALAATMTALLAQISRFSTPEQRARWIRLHYFSECFELAPLWREAGIEALLTTDKDAVTYRLTGKAAEELRTHGRTDLGEIAMIRSHLRLENFVAEAADPPRFLDRIDAMLERFGFVTLFTHEDDIADHRVRTLAMAGVNHLIRRGIPAA